MKMYFCTQIADAALSILHSMASAHSDLDDAGEIVTPTPRVKRILSSPRCLPHVAQVFFSLKFALFFYHQWILLCSYPVYTVDHFFTGA